MSKQVLFLLEFLILMMMVNAEHVELTTKNGTNYIGWSTNADNINIPSDLELVCSSNITAESIEYVKHLTEYEFSTLNIHTIWIIFEICQENRKEIQDDEYVSFEYKINGSWFELKRYEDSNIPTGIISEAFPMNASNVDTVGIRFIVDAGIGTKIYIHNRGIFGYRSTATPTQLPTNIPTTYIPTNNPTLHPTNYMVSNNITNISTSSPPSPTPTLLPTVFPTIFPTLSPSVNNPQILTTLSNKNNNEITYKQNVSKGINITLIIVIFTIALVCVLTVLCFTIILLRYYMKAKEKLEKDFADHHNRMGVNASPIISTSSAISPVPSAPSPFYHDGPSPTPNAQSQSYKIEMIKKVSFYTDKTGTDTPSKKYNNDIEGVTIIRSSYKSKPPLENVASTSIFDSPEFDTPGFDTPGN